MRARAVVLYRVMPGLQGLSGHAWLPWRRCLHRPQLDTDSPGTAGERAAHMHALVTVPVPVPVSVLVRVWLYTFAVHFSVRPPVSAHLPCLTSSPRRRRPHHHLLPPTHPTWVAPTNAKHEHFRGNCCPFLEQVATRLTNPPTP